MGGSPEGNQEKGAPGWSGGESVKTVQDTRKRTPRRDARESRSARPPGPLGNAACHEHESHLEAGRPHSAGRKLQLCVLAVPELPGGRLC